MEPDIILRDEGSIVILSPNTERGTDWLEENVYAEVWTSLGVPCERRYVAPIVDGAIEDGLTVAAN